MLRGVHRAIEARGERVGVSQHGDGVEEGRDAGDHLSWVVGPAERSVAGEQELEARHFRQGEAEAADVTDSGEGVGVAPLFHRTDPMFHGFHNSVYGFGVNTHAAPPWC